MGADKLNPANNESPIEIPDSKESPVNIPEAREYYAESMDYPLFSGYREDLEHEGKIKPNVPSGDHLG